VDFLIRATQADQRTTTLTAPRVTMFSGQQATVEVEQEQAYVATLTPAVAENASAYTPSVSTVQTGTSLTVRPVVSADRRYVTMTLTPNVQVINGFSTYAISQTTTNGGGGTTTGSSSLNGVIQLPTITIQSVQTTVTVPDGGTLLIGGQMLAAEVEKEMGVPILSKIPLINRFFTNRSLVRDESTLLILVKPTIIIPQEYEKSAFPG
jgi:type II secretory pathway component GspD/PulD (secretin)